MIRRTFRIGLWLGLLIGLGAILMRFLRTRSPDSGRTFGTQDFGVPPAPSAPWPPLAVPKPPIPDLPAEPAVPNPRAKPAVAAWVDPDGKICPASHPVKAKLSSGIFHLPGGVNYERTNPERCYVDAAAAEADGLRPSKR